jgi:large subunit ribosomal protein L24
VSKKRVATRKLCIKRGDTVRVIAGKDRGKTGKVLYVDPQAGRVLVESVNFVMRHTRPHRTNVQGGVVQREAPLQVSNVVLVCSRCSQATKVTKKILGDGRNVRVCKKCGEVVDKT